MMSSQRQLSSGGLPNRIAEPRNKKESLYNDVLDLLDSKSVKWRTTEIESSGKNFVQALTNCLWYIDGHQGIRQMAEVQRHLCLPQKSQRGQGTSLDSASYRSGNLDPGYCLSTLLKYRNNR